jgi:hypothetical protein
MGTRYTKTLRDGLFMGWDELSTTAECSEATLAKDLGTAMNEDDLATFQRLGPGEVYSTREFTEYFREW